MEVLVVVSLLSLIVLALMAVFSSTQKAFRSAVTQTDVLEGSRATVELIASDLRTLTPSGGVSNGPVNFFAADNNYFSPLPALNYSPLQQSLPGTVSLRTNLLNYFFILGRENTKWTGIGYAVNPTAQGPLYPLYRFYAETNLAVSPVTLVNSFYSMVNNGQWTNLNHVLDGVVHLAVFACDANGYQLTNTYQFKGGLLTTNRNIQFYPLTTGNTGYSFYSNVVPASVELELGVMEDSTLARAESLPNNLPAASPNDRRSLFLKNQSGAVHLFRQRVSIPNVDPSAYQ